MRRQTTAVELRCERGHLIATVHPFPALGAATQIEVKPRAARYRATLADYVRDPDDTAAMTEGQGWVTEPARGTARLTVDEFSSGTSAWARSATWACRCGLNTLNMQALIEHAWSWSAERGARHGNPPAARVMTLTRTAVP